MKYELRTIKDIFEKIPPDRMDVFLEEFSVGIKQAQNFRTLLELAEKNISGEEAKFFTKENIQFPEVMIWNDDGKGEITTGISINGERQMSIKTILSEKDEE